MQLSEEPLPKLCDGRSASPSALSAQEGASKGEQTIAGVSIEVQEHAAASSTATVLFAQQKSARAASAGSLSSDVALQSREVTGSDAAEDTDAVSSSSHSSAGSFLQDKECAEPEQLQAPHAESPSKHAPYLHKAERHPSSDTSISESSHMNRSKAGLTRGSHGKQHMQPDEDSSTISVRSVALSDGGSRPQPIIVQQGQHAQDEQHMGSKASTADGAAAHQRAPASSSTLSQIWQTRNAEGFATEPLLKEALLQKSGECPSADSASGSSDPASDICQEQERSLKGRVRDPGQAQATRQIHQQAQRAGDGVTPQQRQTDVTLDLAVAVSMVVGLTAVLICGLFMLASTYMSADM